MKHYELPATTQKSYYKKSFVLEIDDNTYLQSYDTVVCGIFEGIFVRFWGDYSTTTMHHINDFRKLNHLEPLNKKEWLAIPVSYCPVSKYEHVAANMGNWY